MSPVGVVVIGRKLEHGMAEGFRAAHGGVGFQGFEHASRELRRRLALHRPVRDQKSPAASIEECLGQFR